MTRCPGRVSARIALACTLASESVRIADQVPEGRAYQRPTASFRAVAVKIRETTLATEPREYEMVVILSPEIGDDAIEASLERLSLGVTSRGGEVTEVNHWGRRRLAYPIKRFLEGNYVVS